MLHKLVFGWALWLLAILFLPIKSALFAQKTIVSPEVIIESDKSVSPSITQSVQTLDSKNLARMAGSSLGEQLRNLPGVATLQSGPTIWKPAIHGLYGNRILILNNGVRLEGQQWGSEHAPEIDPFIANNISIIKGASSLRYGSDALGGVILVAPAALPDTGTEAKFSIIGSSNPLGGAISGMIGHGFTSNLSGLSFRLQGTGRLSGNAKTPDYFMYNTGMQEYNYSASVGYTYKKWKLGAYYSAFNTKLGIFSGSSIGNVADLYSAFSATRPNSPNQFVWQPGRPYQEVQHKLIKLELSRKFAWGTGQMVYAFQQNLRNEFDYIPRNGNARPELNLVLNTHTANMLLKPNKLGKLQSEAGVNLLLQDNVWAGRFFIPNYQNFGTGIFASERLNLHENWLIEGGLRLDYRWQQAILHQNQADINSALLKPENTWINGSANLGSVWILSANTSISANYASAWRPPNMAELYSYGIHQSAASYEIGNNNLGLEKLQNLSLSAEIQKGIFNFQGGLWANYFQNYIYLSPAAKPVSTIRGVFPAFNYLQTKALFYGLDADAHFNIHNWELLAKPTLLIAQNINTGDGLVWVAPSRMEFGLNYNWNGSGRWKGFCTGLSEMLVSRQSHVPANSDYVAPPAAYALTGFTTSAELMQGNLQYTFSLSVNNLFNSRYRDYMDRFRYFSNQLGQSITLRLEIKFKS